MHNNIVNILQSYLAGLSASGALISLLRMLTKFAFEKSHNGLRKGARMLFLLYNPLTHSLDQMILLILLSYCY